MALGALGCAAPAPERDAPATSAEAPKGPSADSPSPPATGSATPTTAAAADDDGAPSGMIPLPAAAYLAGSRTGMGDEEEHPPHEVVLAAIWLDRTEVTTAAYRACVEAGACRPTHTGPFCNQGVAGRDDHPINCVEHGDATAYCAFVGKRLPTEAEWEYAASNGNEKRLYAWGAEEPDRSRACYMHEGSCPVASFPAGAFGLHDMTGNVWEWTSSWWGRYPTEATSGTNRIYRGGSWSRRFPKWMRNTLRNRFRPDQWSASIGMRCAKTRTPLSCPEDAEAKDDACVRVRGAPICETGYRWSGDRCVVGVAGSETAAAPASAGGALSHAAGGTAGGAPSSPGEPPATGSIVRVRSPQFDGDCRSHFPGLPQAYAIQGGDFWAREPVVKASGCRKRDVSKSWTSLCCPGAAPASDETP